MATRFKYTPNQIASMTRQQQSMLLEEDQEAHFDTYEEYLEWKMEQGK